MVFPLEGIKVLDLGAFIAGPLAPMLLGDLGAEVIKVEPVSGDPVRGWRDGFYVACNRGKRGIALNITHPDGRAVMDRFISWADVVHHNIRMTAAQRLGIDRDQIRAVNPDAVFSHGSSYGLLGARADWPGYDSVFQAMAGWNVENAGQDNPPLFVHYGYLDSLTGASSAIATLLALYHRQRTGLATMTSASLLNTATFTNSETLVGLDDGHLGPYPKLDHDQTGLGTGYRIYQSADGWIAVAALDEDSRAALRAIAGAGTDSGAELARAFASRQSADVLADLAAAGVPAETVSELQYFSVFDDEENLRTRIVVSYPQADWGEMRQFGAYWYFGDLDVRLDRACPSLGQHTREILHEFGYTDTHIAALVDAGVVAEAVSTPTTTP